MFAVTLLVVGLTVMTILRWIDHLTRLGRVGETADRVEQAAHEAFAARIRAPWLGGRNLDRNQPLPDDAMEVKSSATGYVEFIDVEALGKWANESNANVFLDALPGTFVHPGRVLARISGGDGDARKRGPERIRDACVVGNERSFDQDPRFGLVVLSEIASRALSAAMNDAGTAIDVVGRMVRLLAAWGQREEPADPPPYPRVWVPPLLLDDLFDDAFRAIARDGAAIVEVALRLQKALAALAEIGGPEYRRAAERQARLALSRAETAMSQKEDKERLRAIVAAAFSAEPSFPDQTRP